MKLSSNELKINNFIHLSLWVKVISFEIVKYSNIKEHYLN